MSLRAQWWSRCFWCYLQGCSIGIPHVLFFGSETVICEKMGLLFKEVGKFVTTHGDGWKRGMKCSKSSEGTSKCTLTCFPTKEIDPINLD